jgi:hypothetical protein
VQRAIAQTKTGNFRGYCVTETPPNFKPAGLTVCIFFSLSIRLTHEHFEGLILHTPLKVKVPSCLDYIGTTTRSAVYVELRCKASVAEEPNGRSRRFKLPSAL